MTAADNFIPDESQHGCYYCDQTCDCGSGPADDDLTYACLGCDDCTRGAADDILPLEEYEARYLASMEARS